MVWKDIKLRTFITEGAERNDLAAHVYDVTYGCLTPYEDNLVIIDDSIVRGTTLRESASDTLSRLLWNRYVASGGTLCLPCCHRTHPGARNAATDSRSL